MTHYAVTTDAAPVDPAYKLVPMISAMVVVWERKTDVEPRLLMLFHAMDLGWPGRGAI